MGGERKATTREAREEVKEGKDMVNKMHRTLSKPKKDMRDEQTAMEMRVVDMLRIVSSPFDRSRTSTMGSTSTDKKGRGKRQSRREIKAVKYEESKEEGRREREEKVVEAKGTNGFVNDIQELPRSMGAQRSQRDENTHCCNIISNGRLINIEYQ